MTHHTARELIPYQTEPKAMRVGAEVVGVCYKLQSKTICNHRPTSFRG